MFLPEIAVFCITLLIYGGILLLLIYYVSSRCEKRDKKNKILIFQFEQVLTLADLECDYLNAQECCRRLNFWVIPKFGCQALLCAMLLICGLV